MAKEEKKKRQGVFPVRSLTDLVLKVLMTIQLMIAEIGVFYLALISTRLIDVVNPETVAFALLTTLALLIASAIIWIIWLKPS